MLQLRRSGTHFAGTEQDLEALREQFAREHCVLLRNFLDPDVVAFLMERMPQSSFNALDHKGIGSEDCLADNVPLGFLWFLTNNQKLFDIVQSVTGCGRIGCFQGRVYRMIPGKGHHDSWHNDMLADRMIGMSINLSRQQFEGGLFQLRYRPTKEMITRVANTGLGDAILFRLRDDLEHLVSNVEGTAEKTAFAGWFKSKPDFRAILHGEIGPSKQ